MLIFAVDGETAPLAELHNAIAQAEPNAKIVDYKTAPELLAALDEEGRAPDAVFSEITLPGMDGLELAARLRERAPKARLVYVTACPQYTMEAFRNHVCGYVLKPAEAGRIREELDAMLLPAAEPETEKLVVRCFGYFEVFYRGNPVIFQRRQSKELFAFLINREGQACSAEEIAAVMWERGEDMKAARSRIRQILFDLRAVLREIGMEDVLIRERRQLAIRLDRVDCDYYRMLAGDPDAARAFRGRYMLQYKWARSTLAQLEDMR